ncbi:hypothetical protein [Zoogloea sp.]|uniref:hypothetical protein n=1 Tax=Zoogloea sp. TaxID=49181 RepID=UPI0035B113C1
MQTSAQHTYSTKPLALGSRVSLEGSNEVGTIIGHATYLNDAPSWRVRYINAHGCLTTDWWPTEALKPIHEATSDKPAALLGVQEKLEIAARLVKKGDAAMSPEDKAAFGIDTFKLTQNTPDELSARVGAFLQALSDRLIEQGDHIRLCKDAPLHQEPGKQTGELG